MLAALVLATSAAAFHPAAMQPALALRPRRRVVPCAHGGGHHNHHAGSGDEGGAAAFQFKLQAPLPALTSLVSYMRAEVLRPLMFSALLSFATMRRHAVMRTSLKKAEFEEDASRVTWLGALVNLALSGFKLFAGIMGHSSAMIADAAHSFSDLISDALTLLALRVASLPADVDHPYGHGRFESVASLAIGALLAGAGVSFGSSSVHALLAPSAAAVGGIALWAAIASIVSKEILYRN